MTDLYETLGLPKNASKADIKKARKKKAQKLHPDRNKDPKAAMEMTAVNAAADILEDDERRARYDQGKGTNRQPSNESEARKAVMMFMNEALQAGARDVPAYVLRKLNERKPAIETEIKKFRTRLAAHQKRLNDVTTDDPDNIFAGLLDGFIRECQGQIEMGEEALKQLEIALQIARRYKSNVKDDPLAPKPVRSGLEEAMANFRAASGPRW